jgi:hypothetical protein
MTTELKNREPSFPGPWKAGDMLSVPWAEDLDEENPFEFQSSYNGGTALSLRIKVRWDDLATAVQEILGYSRRGDESLNRIPPWRCPIANVAGVAFHHLRATQISGMSVLGYGWTAATAKYAVTPGDQIPKNSPNMSRWRHVKLTIVFTAPRYAILADDDIDGDETLRYLNRREESYTEFIKVKGDWLYVEGAGAAASDKVAAADGEQGIQVQRKALFMEWHQLPYNYIYNDAGRAANMEACYGKYNSTEFFGYAPGTLLCEPAKIIEEPAPLGPLVYGLEITDAPVTYRAQLTFKQFDPPLSPGATARGWNLLPDKHDAAGGWALVKLNGNTGRTMYEGADFNTIFDPVTLA